MNHELRIMIFVLFMILASIFLIHPVYAQTPAASPTILQPTTYNLPTYIPPTSPIYTDLLVNNLFHTFSCLAIGQSIIGEPCLTYRVTKNAQGAIQSIPMLSSVNLSGGALGAVTGVVASLYLNPPVRTADYLASVGQDFGIVKEAHAQVGGSGEAVISPILGLWQVSRNIAYVIMIVIFVIIGLMVMFRNKINPQTVITAQAALPGLVIGLILITFSYFLAALLADTAFIGTNLVGSYFSAVINKPPQDLAKNMSSYSVLDIFTGFTATVNPGTLSNGVNTVMSVIDKAGGLPATIIHTAIEFLAYQYGSQAGPVILLPAGLAICGALAGPTLGTSLPACAAVYGISAPIVGGISALLKALADPNGTISLALTVLMVFILIYTMLRLALRLINNYLTIIFLVITAPFQLLFSSLPGRQGLATGWILNMLANILAFPAVLAVFYFVAFILNQPVPPFIISGANHINNNGLIPSAYALDIVGTSTFPLFGGIDLGFVKLLLAFGALMATPAIPDIINRSIGRLGQAGQLIGQEVGGAYGAGQRYVGQAGQAPGQIGKDIGGVQGLASTTTIDETFSAKGVSQGQIRRRSVGPISRIRM